jgi:hypothetical protein
MAKVALACVVLMSLGIGTIAQNPSMKPEMPTPVGPACDGNNFPTKLNNKPTHPVSCCQFGNEITHVGPDGGLARRKLGHACTTATGKHTCVGSGCYYGPCGAHVVSATHTNNTLIFIPHSNPQVCGYQTITFDGHKIESPEKYTDQPLYPEVTPSCDYTTCDTGGPASIITVTTGPSTATGRVKSNLAGITLAGTGRLRKRFARTVTLTAEPRGTHARAVFSGDCIKTGEYGEKAECSIKLTPDPKVTLTYECQKGFTCERDKKD